MLSYFVTLAPLMYLLVLQNNLKMLYWPRNTSPNPHQVLSGSHAAIDSNRKLFSASIIQLQSTVLFNNTYGWLGISIGILLCVEQTILLKLAS